KHVRHRVGIVFRIGGSFGERLVASRSNKFLKLTVGDRGSVNPKTIYADSMRRALFRVVLIRSHAERAAWKEYHCRITLAVQRRLLGPYRVIDVNASASTAMGEAINGGGDAACFHFARVIADAASTVVPTTKLCLVVISLSLKRQQTLSVCGRSQHQIPARLEMRVCVSKKLVRIPNVNGFRS